MSKGLSFPEGMSRGTGERPPRKPGFRRWALGQEVPELQACTEANLTDGGHLSRSHPDFFPRFAPVGGSKSTAWDCKVTPVYGACQGRPTIYCYFTPFIR